MEFQLRPDTTRIVDENGRTTVEADTTLVARAYFHGGVKDLGLLPAAIRWISKDAHAVILERPPSSKIVYFNNETYEIPIPWTVWGIRTSPENARVLKSYLFARPYPLGVTEDELYAFPLPNMAQDSSIALPSVGSNNGKAYADIVNNYWERPFTGAFNEMLEQKEFVPDEWLSDVDEGIAKYFTMLGSYDLESIAFAPLKIAQIPTMGHLCEILEPSASEEQKQETLMEYLERLIQDAKRMAEQL